MPRTAIEAASMSLPVITTDAVGCREVVDNGTNGYLVPIGESEQLSQRIVTLLSDASQYRQMAQNAREKAVAEFDIRTIVTQHLALYKACLKEF
jgi:N,N'-diacetylbacillosaminyl-diphospho-undecaprenol alpha-1,3-N-acetylgalactosaminyltransferase